MSITNVANDNNNNNAINADNTNNSGSKVNNDIKSLEKEFNKLETANTTYINSATQLVAKHELFESQLTELHQLSHQLQQQQQSSNSNSINGDDYKKLVELTKQKNKMLQQFCCEEANKVDYFNEINDHITNLEFCYQQFNDDYLSYYILLHQININNTTNVASEQEDAEDNNNNNSSTSANNSNNNFNDLYNTNFNEEYNSLKESFGQLENIKAKYKQQFEGKLAKIQSSSDNAIQAVRNILANVGNDTSISSNSVTFTNQNLIQELSNCYEKMINEHKYLITDIPTELDSLLNDKQNNAENDLIINLSNYVSQYLDFFSSLKHSISNFMEFIVQAKSRCLLNEVEIEYYNKLQSSSSSTSSTIKYMFDINDYFPNSPSKLSKISNYSISIIKRLQVLQKKDNSKLIMEQSKLNYMQTNNDDDDDDDSDDDDIDIAKLHNKINNLTQRIKERKSTIIQLKSKYSSLILTLFPEWKFFFKGYKALAQILDTNDVLVTDISLSDYTDKEKITTSSGSRNSVFIATPPTLLNDDSNNNNNKSSADNSSSSSSSSSSSKKEKVILKEYDIESAEGRRAFKRESLLLHRLQHPHIASIDLAFITTSTTNNSKAYIQMPFYENRDLLYWRTKATRYSNTNNSSATLAYDTLTEEQVRSILYQSLLALQLLHKHNVVHCDIKVCTQ